MDESAFEQAQRLAEAETKAAIEAARAVPADLPMDIRGVRYCLDCRDPIHPDRIAARPQAVRCMECQEDAEARRRRMGL